jgi:hypothetical protein
MIEFKAHEFVVATSELEAKRIALDRFAKDLKTFPYNFDWPATEIVRSYTEENNITDNDIEIYNDWKEKNKK